MTALLTERPALGRFDLSDLDVTDTADDPDAFDLHEHVDSFTETEWPYPSNYRRPAPDPVFAGDWLARMHDAGAPTRILVRWLDRFAFHRRPNRRQAAFHQGISTAPPPTSVLLAMTRADGETERDHLLRMGRQVPVYDMPDLKPFRRATHMYEGDPGWTRSVFSDSAALPIDAQVVAATSPLLVDRLHLANRGNISRRVLEALADDPGPRVAHAVAAHAKMTPDLARRMWSRGSGPMDQVLVRNPALPVEFRAVLVMGIDVRAADPELVSSLNSFTGLRSCPRSVANAWTYAQRAERA